MMARSLALLALVAASARADVGKLAARKPAPATDPCAAKIARGKWVAFQPPPADAIAGPWMSKRFWTGAKLVQLDGSGRGEAYDACRDRWTAIAAPPVLWPKTSFAFRTWTGEVVWFDVLDHNSKVTGSFTYDPAKDRWATPASAPPIERRATDRGLVLAFPVDRRLSIDFYEHGTATDPVTGATVALPDANAPGPRGQQVQVWTGDRLLVWGGGTQPPEFLGDGAVFDVARWAWIPIAQTGAPAPRALSASGWAGNRLVVWSGLRRRGPNPIECLADGGAYDPVSDRWRAIATADAPSARQGALTVTAGDKLVVYAGMPCNARGGDPLGDGGVYDVTADSWKPFALHLQGLEDHPTVLPDGRVLFASRGATAFAVLDPRTAKVTDIALPKRLQGRVNLRFAVAGTRLLVWGGGRVVSPGGGCGGPRDPGQGCDPVDPTIANETDGYVYGL